MPHTPTGTDGGVIVDEKIVALLTILCTEMYIGNRALCGIYSELAKSMEDFSTINTLISSNQQMNDTLISILGGDKT